MRVLAVTNPAEGHFYPMVPFLWAVRAAGHDVLVCAPESFLQEIADAGLPAVAGAGPMEMVEVMRPDPGNGPPRQPPSPSAARRGTGEGFGRLAVLTHTGVSEVARSWQPDVVVGETSAYAAGIAARRIGCAHVEFRWGIPLHPEIRRAGLQFLGERGLESTEPEHIISVCPPAFLQRAPSDSEWTMRYVPYNGPSLVPEKFLTRPGERRVLVTLGTVLPRYGDVRALVSGIVTALLERDLDIVVGMREADRLKLGDPTTLPAPVREAGWLPLAAVVGTCSAVVHHGGSGTTLTALASGVPQVAIPHFADQFTNAEHLATSGCGVLAATESTGSDVAELIHQVLDTPAYAEQAAAVARNCSAQPTPAAIASILERSVRKGPSSA